MITVLRRLWSWASEVYRDRAEERAWIRRYNKTPVTLTFDGDPCGCMTAVHTRHVDGHSYVDHTETSYCKRHDKGQR